MMYPLLTRAIRIPGCNGGERLTKYDFAILDTFLGNSGVGKKKKERMREKEERKIC